MSIKLKVETPVIKVEAKTGFQYGTLVIGDTTTLPAGSSATVVNVGTEAKAVLNFGVPKGDTGDVASDAKNTFTALNTFRANIAVSNGTTAGSSSTIQLGIKPSSATMQADIGTDVNGAVIFNATEKQGYAFRIGSQVNRLYLTPYNDGIAFKHISTNFATYDTTNGANWLGNANTATQLATARTINGVAFDGTKDIIVDSNPVGTIIAMAYTGVPAGYLHCNGAAVSRTTYAALFALLGTYYGAGDGNSTFNLPNTVAKFLEGGVAAGTYYPAGLPNITGVVGAAYFAALPSTGAFSPTLDVATLDAGGAISNFSNITFDASRSTSIYGASETVQPPALTVIFCIKY